MDPARWQQIDQLFHSALKCEPAERSTFIKQACTGDESLRHEVESLVEFHELSNSFIEAPATDLAAELLAGTQEALEAGQEVGPYKIVSLLGEGGMGEVYLAHDERLGRQVALKLLPAQFTLDADRVRRFQQEARAVSALNHPNIVTIHEIGNSNSQHFITTEFKVPWNEVMPKVRDATLKALSLNTELAEAHTLLGFIMSIDGDDAGAEREYKRAMELDQNSFWAYHFYSNLLRMQGKPEEAVAQQRRALEIEPLSLIVNREYGSKLFFARRYDEAIAQFSKTIELDPAFPSAHYGLALVYWMKGNYAEAVEEHAKHQELNGEPKKAGLLRDSFAKGGWQEFLRTITDKNNHIDLSWDDLAAYYAALGEKSEAFEMLKKRFENRRIRPGALLDPRLDPLRDDPRFAELANAAVLK